MRKTPCKFCGQEIIIDGPNILSTKLFNAFEPDEKTGQTRAVKVYLFHRCKDRNKQTVPARGGV